MIIPLNKYPNQSLTVLLNKQKCHITIKQKKTGVFIDVTVDDKVMVIGQIAINNVPILFHDYRGFNGTITFIDKNGNSNPDFNGFGDKYTLNYEY